MVPIAGPFLALPDTVPDSAPGGRARLGPRHFGGWRCLRICTEQKVIEELHCYLGQEFLWMVFLTRLMLKKHGLSVFSCFSSFFTLWRCVEKSSYCDNVLDDDVLKWGEWVKHDRGAEVTRLAQLTAPRGGRTSLQLLMHPCPRALSLPWGTISSVRVYVVLGPVGRCCYVLVAKSSEELVSQMTSVKHNPTVSTKCSLEQPPSFFLENGMYE